MFSFLSARGASRNPSGEISDPELLQNSLYVRNDTAPPAGVILSNLGLYLISLHPFASRKENMLGSDLRARRRYELTRALQVARNVTIKHWSFCSPSGLGCIFYVFHAFQMDRPFEGPPERPSAFPHLRCTLFSRQVTKATLHVCPGGAEKKEPFDGYGWPQAVLSSLFDSLAAGTAKRSGLALGRAGALRQAQGRALPQFVTTTRLEPRLVSFKAAHSLRAGKQPRPSGAA